jgi:hypothetical protein
LRSTSAQIPRTSTATPSRPRRPTAVLASNSGNHCRTTSRVYGRSTQTSGSSPSTSELRSHIIFKIADYPPAKPVATVAVCPYAIVSLASVRLDGTTELYLDAFSISLSTTAAHNSFPTFLGCRRLALHGTLLSKTSITHHLLTTIDH